MIPEFFYLPFGQMALIATILVTTTSGLLSPLVVLKQRSYLSEALSHLVFPGVIAGLILSQSTNLPLWLCLFIGAGTTAFIGTYLSEFILRKLKIPPDASAIICLTAFFSMGIMTLSSHKGVPISPESLFFGDILTLNKSDIFLMFFSFIVVTFSILPLKKHWDAWLVDREFAQISGFHVVLLDKIFPIILTLFILSGLFAVGGLMISALITAPALLVSPKKAFSPLVVTASLLVGLVGLCLSLVFNFPVGPTIVLVGFLSLLGKTVFFSV